jgi:tetratricopeptide (TPR) repeat protein
MQNFSCQSSIRNLATIIFILNLVTFLFAQEINLNPAQNKEETLTELEIQARNYRLKGLEFQQTGDLDSAMSFYQKAIELDPKYSIAYNDLGIIYEAKGLINQAEESYLKAIKIDPHNLGAFTNLALLYEGKRELEKAGFYWQKRAELGLPFDPWTEKAKKRLNDIRLVLSDRPFEEFREQEVIGLMKELETQKSILKKDNKEQAKAYFGKAKLSFKKGDEVTALKLAIDASQLDPSNLEIEEFINKIQARLLAK